MRYAIRGLILCAALLLAGCAEPPTFSATKPGLPPLAAGTVGATASAACYALVWFPGVRRLTCP
jgi:hypothetical protein